MKDKIIVNTHCNEIYSKTEVILSYKNEQDIRLELIIEIPIKTDLIFESFEAKIKDKIIKSKIIETEKAEEKYNDAIANGNTGVTTSYNLDEKSYSVKIGNLPSGETLILKCYFLQFIFLRNGFYCLSILKEFPKVLNFISTEVEGEVIIETNSEIIIDKNKYKNSSFCNEKKTKYKIIYKNQEIDNNYSKQKI